ncbi:hypothetical protein [Nitrosospira multiformis]|nr:hypothetical protein [Nitrosospira multiformis]
MARQKRARRMSVMPNGWQCWRVLVCCVEKVSEKLWRGVQVLGQESERCIQAEPTSKQGEEIRLAWLM